MQLIPQHHPFCVLQQAFQAYTGLHRKAAGASGAIPQQFKVLSVCQTMAVAPAETAQNADRSAARAGLHKLLAHLKAEGLMGCANCSRC